MSLPTTPPAQDSASSTLAIPVRDPQRPQAVATSSCSSQSSSHDSGPSTPASSIHSSTPSSTLHSSETLPSSTTPHLSDSPTRPSHDQAQSSTPTSSSFVPSPNQAAQDAPEKVTVDSTPNQSQFDPPSITLELSPSSEHSTASHDYCDENGTIQDDIHNSVPEVMPQFTWPSMMKNWIYQRSWLQNTMGSTMLTATLIGLFIYQRRSYRIAVWAAENDFMQSCIGLAQVGSSSSRIAYADDDFQLNKTLSDRCEKIIKEGAGEAPYTKRGFYSIGVGTYKLMKRIVDVTKRGVELGWNTSKIEGAASTSPSGVSSATTRAVSTVALPASNQPSYLCQPGSQYASTVNVCIAETQGTWTTIHYFLLSTSALVILGFLLFWVVSLSRTKPVTTSQARHWSEGVETTSSDGPLRFTDNPRDHHPLRELRWRLIGDRAQEERHRFVNQDGHSSNLDSNNSSTNTLVGTWTGSETSKVSITTGHDYQHYKVKPKHGDVSHVVAKLGAGSAAFTSKQIDEKILPMEKKKRAKGIRGVKEEGERKLAEIKEMKEKKDAKGKTTQRAGDCITGDITHETPTARPTLVL